MIRPGYSQQMTVTDNDTNEWNRMARAANAAGRADVADRMLRAANMRRLPLHEFDAIAEEYREWLVFGRYA